MPSSGDAVRRRPASLAHPPHGITAAFNRGLYRFHHPADLLEQAVRRPAPLLKKLERDASFITGVEKNLNDAPATRSMGVYRVQTGQGPMVLKLYRKAFRMDAMAASLMIHKVLGDLNVAVKLHGVVPEAEVERLIQVFPELGHNPWEEGGHSFGVLMEEVDRPWILRKDITAPAESVAWDKDGIAARIRAAGRLLGRLGVAAGDVQFYVSRSGDAKLADFDDYKWVSSRDEVFGFIPGDDFDPWNDPPGQYHAYLRNDPQAARHWLKTSRNDFSNYLEEFVNFWKPAAPTQSR